MDGRPDSPQRGPDRANPRAARRGGDVATLFPIVAMDANRVSRNSLRGPSSFVARMPIPRNGYRGCAGWGRPRLTPCSLVSPPAAIVGGFGPFRFQWNLPMDAALIDYARRSGFVCVVDDWTINRYRNGRSG